MPAKEFEAKQNDILLFKKRRYVRQMTDTAIKSGKIVRASHCELCAGNDGGIDAHHVDYGKPFEIVWLCASCHGKAHRNEHPLNPKNNQQTAFPAICDKYKNVTVSFTIPVKHFMALKEEAEKLNKPISKILRDEITKSYPINNNQLEFKFEEENDKSQQEEHKGIQRMATNERMVFESEQPILSQIRGNRNLNLSGMEREFHSIFSGHGRTTRELQRACSPG